MSETDEQERTNGGFMQWPLTLALANTNTWCTDSTCELMHSFTNSLNCFKFVLFNLGKWQVLCYLKWYHFACSFTFHKQLSKTDRYIHNCSRTEKHAEFKWKWIWFHGGTFGWYPVLFKRILLARNNSLTLSQVKSELIWTEIFWSSLSKDFLSIVFFPWQMLCTRVQTRSSGLFYTWNLRPGLDYTLTAHTHSYTYQAHLLTPSGCTFHLSIGTELNW